ncbi:hypothetical protein GF318_02675 [Candidatus Micrarchaeota archaeon]|nr:hypothetical protein [Candidatus Micrarchaeota archaeon]
MLDETREFLSKPFNRYLVAALLVLGIAVFFFETAGAGENGKDYELTVHFFYSPSCPHCEMQKEFNQELMQEFPDVKFEYHDVTVPQDSRLLQMMAQNHSIGFSGLGVPATFFNGYAFIGFESRNTTGEKIIQALNQSLEGGEPIAAKEPESIEELTGSIDLPFFGRTDLSGFSLPVLAVVLGLVDGFNPCAMWVLVYLIALLMGFGDRKRMLLVVAIFVAASGILYFLFMTAWLNVFLFLSYVRPVTIMVGLFALGGGIVSVKEFIETKGALVCKVTDVEGRKKMMSDMRSLISAPLTWATLLGIIVLAFSVNSIEFLCSFALPAVFTEVLALSDLSTLEYYAYIALYDIFFMLDDMLVFGLAGWTMSGITGESYAKYCRLVGGVVLLVLGVMLVFSPNLLA